MAKTMAGWKRKFAGFYEYRNGAGKLLALIARDEDTGLWNVEVHPAAREDLLILSNGHDTLSRAKVIAQCVYSTNTRKLLAGETITAHTLRRNAHNPLA